MSHAEHTHSHGRPLRAAPRGVRLVLSAVLIPLVGATIAGLVWLWPAGAELPAAEGLAVDRAKATVLDVHRCENEAPQCRAATVQVTEGAGAPGRAQAIIPSGPRAPAVDAGDKVVLGYVGDAPPGERYTFLDFDRAQPLLWLLVCFVVGVLVLSRLRGVGALAGLAFSLVLISFFALPALLEGTAPLPVAVVTASAIMVVTLYLAHGFNVQTSVAMLGTLLALVLTGVLGSVFTEVGRFTGLAQEESGLLGAVAGHVDLSGLLLAGLVIGALGVLDDVTVTQASAVWELADADPHASMSNLFTRAMRIGRAHVASTVNTLVLAYVGASLPLLLLVSAIDAPFGAVVGQEVIAQEVVRGLVGGLGIIAAVPITTAIATLAARPRTGHSAFPSERSGHPPLGR